MIVRASSCSPKNGRMRRENKGALIFSCGSPKKTVKKSFVQHSCKIRVTRTTFVQHSCCILFLSSDSSYDSSMNHQHESYDECTMEGRILHESPECCTKCARLLHEAINASTTSTQIVHDYHTIYSMTIRLLHEQCTKFGR